MPLAYRHNAELFRGDYLCLSFKKSNCLVFLGMVVKSLEKHLTTLAHSTSV